MHKYNKQLWLGIHVTTGATIDCNIECNVIVKLRLLTKAGDGKEQKLQSALGYPSIVTMLLQGIVRCSILRLSVLTAGSTSCTYSDQRFNLDYQVPNLLKVCLQPGGLHWVVATMGLGN